MKNNSTIWERQDEIISYLVRNNQINLAVEAGKVRDEILEVMKENNRLEKEKV